MRQCVESSEEEEGFKRMALDSFWKTLSQLSSVNGRSFALRSRLTGLFDFWLTALVKGKCWFYSITERMESWFRTWKLWQHCFQEIIQWRFLWAFPDFQTHWSLPSQNCFYLLITKWLFEIGYILRTIEKTFFCAKTFAVALYSFA